MRKFNEIREENEKNATKLAEENKDSAAATTQWATNHPFLGLPPGRTHAQGRVPLSHLKVMIELAWHTWPREG